MPQNKALIKEIFQSIQGEGPYMGVNQLFIRFSKCNLNCSYCDTDFKSDLKEYNSIELLNEIKKYKNIHSVSLTGGEPLTEIDFLLELLPLLDNKIYLETNGTLYNNLLKIIDYTDIVSMDIKLPSATNMPDMFDTHKKFIEIAKKKDLFLKVVFNEKITDYEMEKTVNLAKEYEILIVLQPQMSGNNLCISSDIINGIYNKFTDRYKNVRLIPQVHKFLNLR